MGQGLRRAREMEGALRRREQAADHVHVDPGHDPRHELGMADEIDLRARDLGKPEEADRPFRRRERPAPDGGRERASDLEDRRAARRVVVGARGLVAEVRREDDLARGRVGAGDRRHDDVVGRGDHLRVDARREHDRFARGEPRAEGLGLAFGHHEREAVPELVRREVAPADEVAVVAGPRRRLVRGRRKGSLRRRARGRRGGGPSGGRRPRARAFRERPCSHNPRAWCPLPRRRAAP